MELKEQKPMKTNVPLIDMKKTGERISYLRKLNGLSVKELQECLGLGTPQAIYKWERGLNLPSLDNLLFLSSIFNVSMNSIIVYQNNMPAYSNDDENTLSNYLINVLAIEESRNKSPLAPPNHHSRFMEGKYPED